MSTATLAKQSPASLSELASTATREHGLAIQAGESMLLHAVQAGEALLEAKEQVETGEWVRWLKANFPASDRTAKQYMRIARGREEVLSSGVRTLAAAEQLVPALPRGFYRERPGIEEEEAEAREMHKGGATFQAIAEHFGIAHRTAQSWVIPEYRDNRNRQLREQRRLAREAQERKDTKAVLKKAGAAMAELYANCERMQDVIAQARRECVTDEARRNLAVAEQHHRETRDAVVRALGATEAKR